MNEMMMVVTTIITMMNFRIGMTRSINTSIDLIMKISLPSRIQTTFATTPLARDGRVRDPSYFTPKTKRVE
jgi:hypothetical protein